jgi:hypothetical protein
MIITQEKWNELKSCDDVFLYVVQHMIEQGRPSGGKSSGENI